jgi:hypothetical protein
LLDAWSSSAVALNRAVLWPPRVFSFANSSGAPCRASSTQGSYPVDPSIAFS